MATNSTQLRTTTIPNILAAVATAIEQVKAEYSPAVVSYEPDGEGGAYVFVDLVELRSPPFQKNTWVGFRISYTYPYCDIYPHYVRPDLRIDGGPLVPGMSLQPFRDRQAVQISRRSNHLDPMRDTAASKLRKVLDWLNKIAI